MSSGPTPNFNLRLVGYLFLFTYLQASCRSSHLSKHLTCVSRTYSQLQPVEIFSSISQKHVVSGNQLTSHFHQMTLQPTCPKVKQNTLFKSRILKLFDALDFTSAMYQPSVDCKSLVQAQHRSRENLGAQYKRSQLHLRWCP